LIFKVYFCGFARVYTRKYPRNAHHLPRLQGHVLDVPDQAPEESC
jgi:hypothetical protein